MPAPGVVVSTAVRSGPTGVSRAPSGQYFVIGLTERGPIDKPVKINSMGDYKRVFGERVTYGALYDDLAAFFETGGTQAQVLRVTGAAATVGTLSLMDSHATTPVQTVRVDAASPGAWSSQLTVQIANGSDGATTRKITIALNGVTVEEYNNLPDLATMIARFAASPYVRLTDLASATVAPLNLPKVIAATPLSPGTDDRAAINAARVTSQLALIKQGLGDGAIAAPGYGSAMHAGLIAHARANRRVALLTGPRAASVNDLSVLGLTLGSVAGSEYAGLFGPWIMVSDGAGGLRTISPEGYVAGSRAKAHEAAGPWQMAAGEGSISNYVVGTDVEITKTDHDLLDAARVSPIRVVAGRLRLYGWRSVSSNETDFATLNVADTLNRLVTECEARLEPFVFRTIDGRGQLLAEMAGILIGVVEPIRAVGGLFERTDPVTNEVLDPGYSVDVSPQVNTVESLARNEVKAFVAVRLSPNASLITLTIVKVGLTAAV